MAKKPAPQTWIDEHTILHKIYLIRQQKVMLDSDLAKMYGVETKHLKRQVRRNIDRFPEDFMFELTRDELNILKHQIGTSSWGGNRYLPMAFTEQGVAMLSGVLEGKTAIAVNIRIIRVFTQLRSYALSQHELLLQLAKMETEVKNQSKEIAHIFAVLKELIVPIEEQTPRKRIGFKPNS